MSRLNGLFLMIPVFVVVMFPSGRNATAADRALWTTSKVVGSAEPPDPYRLELAFPKLKFSEPLSAAVVPGSKRLMIAERHGKIFTFEPKVADPQPQLLVDLQRTIYGVVAHPQFEKNGFVFVSTVLDAMNPAPNGSRLTRLTVTDRKALVADAKSETLLLEWPSGGHNGGCLRFGPDGMLYLATGDGSGIADSLLTGQDVSDVLGAMLRLDVDHPTEGKAYGVPKDNPFVTPPGPPSERGGKNQAPPSERGGKNQAPPSERGGKMQARGEIWSYGHRQVWKFSFDAATGQLWAGEVGQDLWEMIYLIQRGGNYGWSVREGLHPFRPERPKGPSPFIDPIVEHPHSDFRSITGGWVYHGKRLPELAGAYIYGDYDTGKVWMLRYDAKAKKVTENRELCDTQVRIVEIIQDADGEILFVDFAGGGLHRLSPVPPPSADAPKFPHKLSETGLFASTKDHQPAPGTIPYDVIAPLWSDGASKDRFLALPGDGKIEFDVVIYPSPAPGSLPGWRFPDGTVLVKTFSLELELGNSASKRRLETRLLHHIKMPGNDDEYGAQVWNGYTYIWNDEQTDAELLEAKGADRVFTIKDAAAPKGARELKWHFPSRAECTLCHTMAAKYVLGVTTAQMNHEFNYGDGHKENQLKYLDKLGVFTKPLPSEPEITLTRLVDYHDTRHSLDTRARSYLHANCSHCHRKWGGGNAEFQLLASQLVSETGTVNTKPGQGTFDLRDPRILIPGDPARSLIWHRMQKTGLGRMPHVASNVVDQEAVTLIEQWIHSLK